MDLLAVFKARKKAQRYQESQHQKSHRDRPFYSWILHIDEVKQSGNCAEGHKRNQETNKSSFPSCGWRPKVFFELLETLVGRKELGLGEPGHGSERLEKLGRTLLKDLLVVIKAE